MWRPPQLHRLAPLAAGFAAASVANAVPLAVPSFHMAPAALAEPADTDADAAAHATPLTYRIEAAQRAIATARLTPQALGQQLARVRVQAAGARPLAGGVVAAVFTPAQIRMAYGLPELPAAGAPVTAAAAAALGAGQTIYVVDANHNPNTLEDLNRFSTKFGLPTCTGVAVTRLPLPPARDGCTFSVAYADGSALRSTPPAWDAGWAAEIAIDVQWAHAIAPRARIVLVEAAGAMSDQLAGAVALANRMGPGVVSMSFGAPEGRWMGGLDGTFAAPGMSYVAASGDDGAHVNWPAASRRVLAVGGTSLAWAGGGTRHETAWSGSAGGVSAYVALPPWQSGLALPGGGALARRAVSDVAFNANPFTGQYVALTPPGSSATRWNAYGGTSIAAPQWAGIVAIANAIRANAAKERLGDLHATLYQGIAVVPGLYAAAFADVTEGRDGDCASCTAAVGYDAPTGWGTPNVAGLLPLLTGVVERAPVVTALAVPGGRFGAHVGAAFAQSLGVTAPAGVSTRYALEGAPAGLRVTDRGVLHWAAPVAGSWPFVARATTSAGASASARYTIAVAANRAPVFVDGRLGATTSTAFGAQLAAVDPDGDPMTYTMSGGPAGIELSTAGALHWAHPARGRYVLGVTARDAGGLEARATWTLSVTDANVAPVVAAAAATGRRGARLAVQMVASDANGEPLRWTLGGAPAGMAISATGRVTWRPSAAGTWSVVVRASDARGAVGTAPLAITITAAGGSATPRGKSPAHGRVARRVA